MNRLIEFVLYTLGGLACLILLLYVASVALRALSSSSEPIMTGIAVIAVSYVLGRLMHWIYDGRMAVKEAERIQEELERKTRIRRWAPQELPRSTSRLSS